jgi:hypothetical protein
MPVKTKRMAVLVVAVLATAAMNIGVTPGASAAEFKCEVSNCLYTGFQEASPNDTKINIGTGLSVSCTESMFAAYSATAITSELTVTPTVSNCTSSVGALTFKFNHCDTDLTAATTGEHGGVHTTCSEATQIEITTGGCTIKIGSQTPKGGARYTNKEEGGKQHITLQTTKQNIAYTKSGLTCGFVSGEMSMTGAYTVKCYGGGSRAQSATTTFTYGHSNSQVNCEYKA